MASLTSDQTKKGKIEYTECYKVIYSPGELKKAGNRVWHDGILTFLTINQKLTLRDDRGHLLDESFYTELPRPDTRPIKEEDQRPATIATGIPFQINESFIVEVERVKFIHEKVFEIGSLRGSTPQQRRSRPLPDAFKDVEDVLEKYIASGKSAAAAAAAAAAKWAEMKR